MLVPFGGFAQLGDSLDNHAEVRAASQAYRLLPAIVENEFLVEWND